MTASNQEKSTSVLTALIEFITTNELLTKEKCKAIQSSEQGNRFAYSTMRKYMDRNYFQELKRPDSKIKIIESLEAYIGHCGFTLTRSDPDDSFSCINKEGKLQVTSAAMDTNPRIIISDFYYVNSDREIICLTLRIDRATMQIQLIDPTGKRETEEGEFKEVNPSVFLLMFKNKLGNPYWIVSYAVSNSGKDLRQCLYLKISRKKSEPAVGFVVIIEKPAGHKYRKNTTASTADRNELEAFIAFLLLDKRRQLDITKFRSANVFDKAGESVKATEFRELENWKSLKEFTGTWEAFFINPIEPCFETAILTMQRNGKFNMWVPVDTGNRAYTGVCRMVNDLLVIRYDHLPELDSYRSTIIVNAAGYKNKPYSAGAQNTMLYGILAGVERNKSRPVATRFVMRKRSEKFWDKAEIVKHLDIRILNGKTEKSDLLKRLDELKIREFMTGELLQEIVSTDWLRAVL